MKLNLMTVIGLASTALLTTPALADNGYSCNNASAIIKLDTDTRVIAQQEFSNGVKYTEYADDYGETAVRLSGEGISGGMCFDSVSSGRQFFAETTGWGFRCNNVAPLGSVVNSIGTNPKVTLAKIDVAEGIDNYGLRLSGEGVSGGICFEDPKQGFKYLAFFRDGSYSINGNLTGDKARIKGQNGYIALAGLDVGGKMMAKWDASAF